MDTQSKERMAQAKREADDRIRAYKDMFDKIAAAEKDATSKKKDAEKEKTKATADGVAERLRQEKQGEAIVTAMGKAAVREHDARQREHTASVKKYAREREQAETASMNATAAARRRFQQAIGGGIATGIAHGASATLGVGGQMLNSALSLGGGFTLAGAIQERMAASKSFALLSTAAYDPSAAYDPTKKYQKNQRANSKELLAEGRRVSIETGTDLNELATGTHDYVSKASDLDGGMKNMSFFAKLAKGNGAKFGDVTKTFGMLRAQNDDLGVDDAKELMLNVVAQGRKGAIEMPDVARVASKITKSASNFDMSQTDAQRQLLGLAQIAIKTSGSPAEAATSISNFSDDMLHHGQLYGINKNARNGRVQGDMGDNFAQVFRAAHGNVDMMGTSEAQGGYNFTKRSMKMLQAVSSDYEKGRKSAGEGATEEQMNEAGALAVKAKIDGSTAAKYDESKAMEDFAAMMAEESSDIEVAVIKLKDAMGDALLPVIKQLIPIIKDMTPLFADVAGKAMPAFADAMKSVASFAQENKKSIAYMASHPIGTLIAGKVTESFAKSALTAALQGANGGLIGLGLAAAALAVYFGMMAIDKKIGDKTKNEATNLELRNTGHNLAQSWQVNGPHTAAETVAAKDQMQMVHARIAAQLQKTHEGNEEADKSDDAVRRLTGDRDTSKWKKEDFEKAEAGGKGETDREGKTRINKKMRDDQERDLIETKKELGVQLADVTKAFEALNHAMGTNPNAPNRLGNQVVLPPAK